MADPKQIVRDGYDAVSYAYRADQVDHALERKYAAWISALGPILPAGADVLELGCGCGVPGARLLASKYKLTGIDISPVQIERARSFVPNAIFHCADFTSFPLEPASFDAIVSFYAIIHVPVAEHPCLLRTVATALRPGGALLIIVGHDEWTGVEKDWLGVAGAMMYWSHECVGETKQWIEAAGLQIQQCDFVPERDSGHWLILAVKP